MGTIYKKLCIMCVAALTGLSARSQVSTLYTFSQFPGTYSAITGGTVFSTSAFDDEDIVDPLGTGFIPPATLPGATGPGVDIGFNFVFNNYVFNRMAMSNNGYLVFGNSADGNLAISESLSDWNRPISALSTSAPKFQHRISAIGSDMLGTTTSNIRVQTLGTAPTRTTVIQWANYQFYAPPPATADNINFQIKLYETTGMVDVVYGTFVTSLDSCGQVGLKGGSNTDYNNRSVSPPNVWNTSVAGTANNYFVRYNSTLYPASGLTYRWSLQQCAGTLASLTTTGTALVCPNEAFALSLQNTYTVAGITYTWSSSTTQTGIYSPINNSNSSSLNVPSITSGTWYRLESTCIHGGTNINSVPFYVQLSGTTVNTIPYYEGFEGVTSNNRLPNCSWASNNLGTTAQTYTSTQGNNRVARTGSKFASFYQTPSTPNYFYTNGLQLTAGITYSAGLWFTTEYQGYTNWTELAILVGASQTTTGLSPIVSVGPAISGPYKALGGTFTVPSSGLYYVAVKGVSGAGLAQYLSWDDLSVTIPCTGNGAPNSPTVITSASSNTVCHGIPVTLSASGADTYTWSNGASGPITTVNPDSTTVYSVLGTNALTGCTELKMETIHVKPSPVVTVLANAPIICPGSSVAITAYGASTYMWGTGAGNSVITVTPAGTTIYTVTGTNGINCSTTATIQIQAYPSYSITVSANVSTPVCKDEPVILTASGAVTYTWVSGQSGLVSLGSPVTVHPMATGIYSVSGLSANGCKQTASYSQIVNACVGLNELTTKPASVYPNPTSGLLTIDFGTTAARTLQMYDMWGRLISSANSDELSTNLYVNELPNGIYFLKISSENSSEMIKIIKY